MKRKGNPPTLLVGMQAGTATLENSMEVPQKVENRATLWPSNCTTAVTLLSIYPTDINVVIRRGTCPRMFTAAISTKAKLWKEPRCPSTDEWIKKMWYIYTMEYYVVIKRNEILPFTMTWMELEGIMQSEVSQSEKDNYHMISLIWGIWEVGHGIVGGRKGKMKQDGTREGDKP